MSPSVCMVTVKSNLEIFYCFCYSWFLVKLNIPKQNKKII